jgi:hypothetical protein
MNIDCISPKETQEEQQTSQTTISLYRGREVISPPSFTHAHLSISHSLVDKMFTYLGKAFETDPNMISQNMPKNFTNLLRQIDMINERIEFAENNTSPFSFIGLQPTLEEEIEQEESKEQMQLMLQEAIEEKLNHFGKLKKQQLALAGVASTREFEEKQAKIAHYCAIAEKLYLQDAHYVEKRKEIDRCLIQAYKKKLSDADLAIIDQYWNFIATSSDALSKKNALENRLIRMNFNENSTEMMMQSLSKEELEQGKVKEAQFMKQYIQKMIQNAARQIEEELSQCENPQVKLLLEYLRLTGACQMSFIANCMLRNLLLPKLAEAESQEKSWVSFFRKLNLENIESIQSFIQERQQKLQNSQKKLTDDKIDKDCWKTIINLDRQCLEDHEKLLLELQAKTEEDFKKLAHLEIAETPEQIKDLIPLETPFEQLFSDLMSIETQQGFQISAQSSLLNLFEHMRLDLAKCDDPVAYFVQLLLKIDDEKLKRCKMKPKVEALD